MTYTFLFWTLRSPAVRSRVPDQGSGFSSSIATDQGGLRNRGSGRHASSSSARREEAQD